MTNEEQLVKEHDHHDDTNSPASKPEKEFFIRVVYNGMPKPLEVKLQEHIKKALKEAIDAFGSLPAPHTLALFTEAGIELNDEQTVKEAGLKSNEEILLRPSQVKGG